MYFESHHIFSTDVFSKNEYLRFKTSGYRSKRSTSCMLADFPSRALAAKVWALAIPDPVKTTGHNLKWDSFGILASSKSDFHCKI